MNRPEVSGPLPPSNSAPKFGLPNQHPHTSHTLLAPEAPPVSSDPRAPYPPLNFNPDDRLYDQRPLPMRGAQMNKGVAPRPHTNLHPPRDRMLYPGYETAPERPNFEAVPDRGHHMVFDGPRAASFNPGFRQAASAGHPYHNRPGPLPQHGMQHPQHGMQHPQHGMQPDRIPDRPDRRGVPLSQPSYSGRQSAGPQLDISDQQINMILSLRPEQIETLSPAEQENVRKLQQKFHQTHH
jgi:hypothetical protein